MQRLRSIGSFEVPTLCCVCRAGMSRSGTTLSLPQNEIRSDGAWPLTGTFPKSYADENDGGRRRSSCPALNGGEPDRQDREQPRRSFDGCWSAPATQDDARARSTPARDPIENLHSNLAVILGRATGARATPKRAWEQPARGRRRRLAPVAVLMRYLTGGKKRRPL